MKPSSTNEVPPGKHFARPSAKPCRVFCGRSLAADAISRTRERLLFLGDSNTLAALWRVGAGTRPGDRVIDLGEPLRLDDQLISDARERVGTADGHHLVAVGGGTINDLAKLLAAESGRAFSLVATCASMNGWVSANASIVRGGNKISVSAFSPARVLLDDALLAAAPATLTAAGFADALCGPFACRDWLVAHLADATDYEPTIAAAIMTSLDPLASALAANASRDTLRPLLVDALLTGGLAMSEAHSSAPASGAEHLVAHAVDLLEIARGARPTLHGHAVAIGTLLVAALWEVVGDELRALGTAASRQRRVSASVDERATALGTWLPTLASDAENIVRAKHARERERRPMHAICTDIRALAELPSVAQVRARLRAAGAPTHAADIHVDGAFLRMALLSARDMRDRTTVFDLAHDLGVLPARLDEVVARSKLVER